MVKTCESNLVDLNDYVREHHSYDCPEIIAVPIVKGDSAYLNFVMNAAPV